MASADADVRFLTDVSDVSELLTADKSAAADATQSPRSLEGRHRCH
jgi:hypothetical protein